MEINSPPCPTHGSIPRALHSENFEGIVTVIENIIETVSGVGTISYSRCPYGYPSNFEGVVRVLEDLNTSISGIQGGGGGGGSASGIAAGSGIYITQSGDIQIINADVQGGGGGSVSGSSVTVGTAPDAGYTTGALWFDTNEGRLFVYASGSSVPEPDWYQTNAEALVYKSEEPPSGAGYNAPARDGSIWFNTLLGSLFVYDATSSGWYEASASQKAPYTPAAPSPTAEGALWVDSSANQLKVWDGSAWVLV
jgi:hypothetical protein